MKYIFIVATIFILSCGLLKDIGKTANDAAIILCKLSASENKERLDGLSPSEWCAIHENLYPFLEEVLSAKRNSEDRLKMSGE